MHTMTMVSYHVPGLVGLSVLIAIMASYAALDLAGRVTAAAGGRAQAIWLTGGALAMGLGIWSMHYVGMLAFRLPIPVFYDVPTVLVSLLAAVLASAVALWVVSRRSMTLANAVPGSVVMGLGIAAMHYTGMAAMRLQAAARYNALLVVVSILIAMVVSFVALWLAFHLREPCPRGHRWRKLSSAILMGAAIPSMHYTAMAAVHFSLAGTAPHAGYAVGIPALGATALAATTCMVLALAIVTSLLDRRFSAETTALRERARADLTRLASFPELNPSPVFETDLAGAVVYCNPAAGRAFPDLVSAGQSHPLRQGLVAAAATLGDSGEEAVVRELRIGGRVYEQRISFVPENARIIAYCADITEHQRAEEALRAHQRFLREIIDAHPHLIFVKDWDGRFTLANRALVEIYGTTPEALVGKTDADFNPNAEEVERFLRDDRQVMASGQPLMIPEEPVTNAATGETRWFQTIKVPLVPTDGGVRQVLGVATDITRRKQLEDQLRHSQKMEAVGRLAGGVAHDFNNLLTAILGHADLLLEGMPRDDSRRADLGEVKRAAERAAGLTRQLLAFSRKQILQPKVLDLNSVVTGMGTLLRRLIGEDVELCIVPGHGLGAVEADPGQLEQVILNLAVNARDAMPRGGRLTIETASVQLDGAYAREHAAVKPGPYVMLAVTDAGVGMDEHVKAHLFEPFFTTKEQGKGTGLGLATVYGIVQQSGGFIWVYSEPGRGSTFKIYFPRVSAALEDSERAAAPQASLAGSGTILLAEDEEAVRRLASRVLEARGYTVLLAADGLQALDTIERHTGTIDLLITDVVMPRMGGRELAERAQPRRPDTKVLYLSGYTDDAVVRHGALDAGVAFLQKPFTPDSLARKVKDILNSN